MNQNKFFGDKNRDGIADGLQEDTNRDGRPDFMEKYLRKTEKRFIITGILGLVAATLIPAIIGLIVDYIGHILGWH